MISAVPRPQPSSLVQSTSGRPLKRRGVGSVDVCDAYDTSVRRHCGRSISGASFALSKCNHRLCVLCAGQAFADMQCQPYVTCPAKDCGEMSSKWMAAETIKRREVGASTRSGDAPIRITEHEDTRSCEINLNVDIEKHPMVYHRLLPDNIREKTVITAMALPNGKNTRQMATELSIDGPEYWGEESKRVLESHGMGYHSLFRAPLKKGTREDPEPYDFADDRNVGDVANGDNSAFHRFLHPIGTGRTLEQTKNIMEKSKNKARWQTVVNSSFSATDVLRNIASTSDGVLKGVVSNQLTAYNVPNPIHKLLNVLGISSSKEKLWMKDLLAAKEKLAVGWDPKGKRWSLLVVCYDNIGFKTLGGKKVGYDQYTMLQIVEFTKEELVAWKIYPDPKQDGPWKDVLSWQPENNWDDIKHEMDLTKEVTPGKEEVGQLAPTSLSGIDSILKLEKDGKLPTYNDAKVFVESTNKIVMDWSDSVPRQLGAGKNADVAGTLSSITTATDIAADEVDDVDADGVAQDEEEEEDCDYDELPSMSVPTPKNSRKNTQYQVNRATIDRAMHKDLNATKTVRLLMQYADELLNLVIEKGSDLEDEGEKEFWEGIILAMQRFGIQLAGDGSPAFAASSLKKKHPELSQKETS